mgnify:CR=1 FL=1
MSDCVSNVMLYRVMISLYSRDNLDIGLGEVFMWISNLSTQRLVTYL